MVEKKGKSTAMRSESIVEARFSLTAKQNELLDMLFCEMKDDDKFRYTISVDKYKEYYETDTSNLYRDMKKAVKSFEGKGFRIANKDTSEEIYYAWFSKIHYMPKKGEIEVNIDPDFKKILWEVKKKIYYDVRYTLNFNSAYSQRMYYYLKSFEDTGWRVDSIEQLLQKLECPKSYKNFADFKRAVLDVAEKEINTTSDILFSYETKKTGKKITNIKFYIKSKDKIKSDTTFNEVSVDKITDNNTQLILQVKAIVVEGISEKDAISILKLSKNNVNLIKEKYALIKRQNHVIDNIIALLKSAIKEDYREKKSVQRVDAFNDFEQRKYDGTDGQMTIDDLERRLLGWDKIATEA